MLKTDASRQLLLAASLLLAAPIHAQVDAAQKAMMSVVGLDVTSGEIVTWCETRVPNASPPLRLAWQAWRRKSELDAIIAQLDAGLMQRTRDGMATVVAATQQKLAGAGLPSSVCPQLVSMWNSAEFDTKRSYPEAYTARAATVTTPISPPAARAAPTVAAAAPAGGGNSGAFAKPNGRFNTEYYASNPRPTGTVYTVAQITALKNQWTGTPWDYQRGLANMRAAGVLYIRGRVNRRNERTFIDVTSSDGAFASRLSFAPNIDLSAFDGQEITVEAELEELPNSMIFPRQTRVVRDPSGLRPSPLPDGPGMRRLTVAASRITAPPGRGVRPPDVVGMHYVAFGRTGYSGYEFVEELRLLFKDGWAYERTTIAPGDLDVAASRRLEPQQWSRWRLSGREYEFQEMDDYGKASGTWQRKPGQVLAGWPANKQLVGSYTATAFYGSIALGGTYTSNSFVFKPNGRWESINFSRSSSAAMAANEPVGFSSSAASVSDGSGTKSSAGGGISGSSNGSVYAATSSSRDDGAKNRGTYKLDGMSIALTSDAGTVTRLLCVPLDDRFQRFYMLGQSYSNK